MMKPRKPVFSMFPNIKPSLDSLRNHFKIRAMGPTCDYKMVGGGGGGGCDCQDTTKNTFKPPGGASTLNINMPYSQFVNTATVLSVAFNMASDGHVVIATAAVVAYPSVFPSSTDVGLEMPKGSDIADQRQILQWSIGYPWLFEAEACLALDAGNYTVFLVNRSGGGMNLVYAWLKVIPLW